MEGDELTVSEAVVAKILNICDEKNITINKLSTICGITQSTLDNIVNGNNGEIVSNVKKLVISNNFSFSTVS